MAPKKRFYRFVKCMFLALTVAFATGAAFAACSSNQIDVTGNGSNCQTAKFTLTTTSTTTSFQFSLSAAGTFYVDCGDGGTLSGTGASGKTITKTNLSGYTYTCSWNSAGAHTIRFGGAATGYGSGEWIHTIRFNINGNDSANENVKKIASISGSLGAIFGTIDGTPVPDNGVSQPKFHFAFAHATNLTGTIPEDLFDGIHGAPIERMFQGLFYGCTGLTGTIPTSLFSGLSGAPANNMFENMFYNCSGLNRMGRGSITTNYIPRTFLSGITSGTATNPIQNMFYGTGLASSCPNGTSSYTPTQFANNTGKAWCAGGPHTITYKAGQGGKAANGGAAVDVSQEGLWYGEAFTTLPANTFSKPHAIFTGWEASASPGYPNANTEYQYNNTASITMTALWQCEPDYVLNTTNGECTWPHTYTITYDCGTGATGSVYQQGVEPGVRFQLREATGCSKPGHTFAGWRVSGGGNVFYPQSNNPDGYTWAELESQIGTTLNSLALEAEWTANTYTITVVAGNGVSKVAGTAWTGTGTGTMTKNFTYGSTINLATVVTPTFKTGYNTPGYTNSGNGTISGTTYTVGAGSDTITVAATGISSPATISITPTTTISDTYNSSGSVSFSATDVSGNYDSGITVYYQKYIATYSNSTCGAYSATGSATTSNSFSVAKNAFRGYRCFKVKAYATDGTLTSAETESENYALVYLAQKRLRFYEGSDYVDKYARYNTQSLYTSATNNTTTTVPTVTEKTGYTFNGWWTLITGGSQVIDANGTIKPSISGYTDASAKWILTGSKTLYAQWTANTINIVWDGVTSQEALAENVKQVTYDGDIHTPQGANLVQQTGIDFVGWKFKK